MYKKHFTKLKPKFSSSIFDILQCIQIFYLKYVWRAYIHFITMLSTIIFIIYDHLSLYVFKEILNPKMKLSWITQPQAIPNLNFFLLLSIKHLVECY